MSDERDEGRMPPIPDGGLSESMPEWLRRPPAWRTLNDAEVVQPEPTQVSDLPEADTSVIDPRMFLSDADLPEWLRRLGSSRQHTEPGRPADEESVAGSDTGGDSINSGDATSAGASREGRAPAPRQSVRFVPRNPSVPASSGEPSRRATSQRTPRAAPGGSEGADTPWWRGTPIVLLLAILLFVAIGVIIALVVA